MTEAVEDVQRPSRGHALHNGGQAKPGRAVPTLAPGPPPPRATYLYAVLAGVAAPPQGRRRLPTVTASIEALAGLAGMSPRATRKALARLRRHGWLASSRELRPGRWRGRLRGRGVHTLIWPPDLLPRDDVAAGRQRQTPHPQGGSEHAA